MKQLHDDIVLVAGLNELNVQLTPTAPPPGLANLYGKVTDSVTQEGLPDVSVQVRSYPRLLATFSTTTDSSGNYLIENIPLGSYQIQSKKDGYEVATEFIMLVEGNNEFNINLVSMIKELPSVDIPGVGICSLVGFNVPKEIVSGSEFWASQTVSLVYGDNMVYSPILMLARKAWIITKVITICGARISGPDSYYTQVPLTHTGNYTITGIAKGTEPVSEVTFEPAKATLPKGEYWVLSRLRYGFMVGPKEVHGMFDAWTATPVGEITII